MVMYIDEKNQIQALDRSQPGLPLKNGRCGTMTHDYKRNGTATLFAALNVADGTVISMCHDRHRLPEMVAVPACDGSGEASQQRSDCRQLCPINTSRCSDG